MFHARGSTNWSPCAPTLHTDHPHRKCYDIWIMPAPTPGTVARLMASFRHGDKGAAGELIELFYPELRRLALARMKRERTNHTWQPTALINELYLELLKINALRDGGEGEDEKLAFFGLSAHLMKRLLIHHSRPLSSRVTKLPLPDNNKLKTSAYENMHEVEEALSRLETTRPELRAVVELKVFEGLTEDEIAERLGCARSTVARHWRFARHWLRREMVDGGGDEPPS
jgi:RNA polymerase sigma factor (TIGR02999 family)